LGMNGLTATIVANDANGNLLLSTVATTTVDSNGDFSVVLTTALPKGTVLLSVTVMGVASDIINVSLADPFGIVFDSATNLPIHGAVVSLFRSSDAQLATVADGDIDASDANPQTVGTDGLYSFLTSSGNYFFQISADGYDFPSKVEAFDEWF